MAQGLRTRGLLSGKGATFSESTETRRQAPQARRDGIPAGFPGSKEDFDIFNQRSGLKESTDGVKATYDAVKECSNSIKESCDNLEKSMGEGDMEGALGHHAKICEAVETMGQHCESLRR